jgi:glutamine synthetase
MTAEAFKIVADRMAAGESASDIAISLLNEHWNVIYNGNGYDPTWPDKAVELGPQRTGPHTSCLYPH